MFLNDININIDIELLIKWTLLKSWKKKKMTITLVQQ